MAIQVKRLPEYSVTVVIWSGRLTLEQVHRHVETLEAAGTDRWLNYFNATADLSDLSIAALPELKRLTAAKVKEIYGDKHLSVALVSDAEIRELFPEFWPSYAAADHAAPVEKAAFANLEAACEWLNLPDDGCRAVIGAIEGSQGAKRDSGARPPRDADARSEP